MHIGNIYTSMGEYEGLFVKTSSPSLLQSYGMAEGGAVGPGGRAWSLHPQSGQSALKLYPLLGVAST